MHDGVYIIIEQIHRVGCFRFVALLGRYLSMTYMSILAFATFIFDSASFANIEEPKTETLGKITKRHVNGKPFAPMFRVSRSKP